MRFTALLFTVAASALSVMAMPASNSAALDNFDQLKAKYVDFDTKMNDLVASYKSIQDHANASDATIVSRDAAHNACAGAGWIPIIGPIISAICGGVADATS